MAAAIIGAVAVVQLVPGLLSFGRDPWVTTSSVRSELLAREMPVEIFSPPQIHDCPLEERKLLLVFHGRGADQTQWFAGRFGTGAHLDTTAHRLIESGDIPPVVIVSASIHASYGVDSEPAADAYTHGPYERFILDELLPELERRLAVGGTPRTRAIAGVSAASSR
jgi:enterochelin esterase-like enzyme